MVTSCANFDKADKAIDSGEVQAALFSVEYTETETRVINNAIKNYIRFRDVWGYFAGVDYVLMDNGQQKIYEDYAALRVSYFELEALIAANFEKYDLTTQKLLLYYQKEARAVDEDMQKGRTISGVTRYADIVLRMASNIM